MDSNAQNDQFNYMKERVKNLEVDLEKNIREKTDATLAPGEATCALICLILFLALCFNPLHVMF